MLTDNAVKRIRTQEPYLETLLNNYRMSEDINESGHQKFTFKHNSGKYNDRTVTFNEFGQLICNCKFFTRINYHVFIV